jgi:hypothetical protein
MIFLKDYVLKKNKFETSKKARRRWDYGFPYYALIMPLSH